MGKHLDPLEKEFLIKSYLARPDIKLSDFCDVNSVSNTAFSKWLKQYESQGIEGAVRRTQIRTEEKREKTRKQVIAR